MKMMTRLVRGTRKFFEVLWSRQAYLNLVYLLAAFPLGVLYFIFLVTGLATGLSLTIVWVGIPLLLMVGVGWWALASFERLLAILCLKEELPPMRKAAPAGQGLWAFLKGYLTDPVTWKSPIFLLLKFPLSTATFSILVTLVTLTLGLLTLPLTYQQVDVQFEGFFAPDRAVWQVDGMWEALLGTALGLVLWPATLWIVSGLAWLHGKFARIMLSAEPLSIGGGMT
jgi:hypothetical protein